MKIYPCEVYETPKIVWKRSFAFIPRWLEDKSYFVWLEPVWLKERQYGNSWLFSERSWEFFSKRVLE